jgi:hypothetical protein
MWVGGGSGSNNNDDIMIHTINHSIKYTRQQTSSIWFISSIHFNTKFFFHLVLLLLLLLCAEDEKFFMSHLHFITARLRLYLCVWFVHILYKFTRTWCFLIFWVLIKGMELKILEVWGWFDRYFGILWGVVMVYGFRCNWTGYFWILDILELT